MVLVAFYWPFLSETQSFYLSDLTYYFVRRDVRMLADYTPRALFFFLGPETEHVVFLLKAEEYLMTRDYYRYWQRPPGYTRLYSDDNVDILRMRPLSRDIEKDRR